MAKKRMEERPAIEVYIGKYGHICIKQEETYYEDKIVILEKDQVPIVIQWLEETLAERNQIPDEEYELPEDSD